MFNDLSTPLALLRTRRSGRPREMVAPGPDPQQLDELLALATRVPDHGKLFPWRMLVIDDRDAFAALLAQALRDEDPEARAFNFEAADAFARQAPTLVAVLSAPAVPSKIPLWEQELSAGALCMNLLHAAHAMGFVAGWLTGWPAYSPAVREALGSPGQRIAGFIFIGSPGAPLAERPRPEPAAVAGRWPPRA